MVGTKGRIGLFILSAVVMGANVGLLRGLWGLVHGWDVPTGQRVNESGERQNQEEPRALRELKENVNGTLRRREDMIREKSSKS